MGCNDMETVWTITCSLNTWHDHVLMDSRVKLGVEGDGGNWSTDIMEIRWIELCVISTIL